MRILLVEDDSVIAEGLCALLTSNGYVVDLQTTVGGALEQIEIESYDCLVVDRGLPDGDGMAVVSAARYNLKGIPILFLTARSQPGAVIDGLDAGADDYLSKPFLPDVLLARLRALIRRKDRSTAAPTVNIGDITVNTNSHEVTRLGQRIHLSPKEYQLLEYLLAHTGEAVDRQTLLDHVWGEEADMFSNTVDVHVRYLRHKLDRSGKPSLITTVRGKGYMICPE